jgi:hypothetical protein
MSAPDRVIRIHPAAPPQPAPGAPCNGCGVCCLAEPCPAGVLWSRRREGACVLVRWDEAATRYVCGLLADPAACLPAWLRPVPGLARGLRRVAARSIAAGIGCDCTLETERPAGGPGGA